MRLAPGSDVVSARGSLVFQISHGLFVVLSLLHAVEGRALAITSKQKLWLWA